MSVRCRGSVSGRAFAFVVSLVWSASTLAAEAQTRVVLQLRFDHQFQFAGYYAALWNGYYRQAGIDVQILPGVRPDGSILRVADEMAAGRADFGIAGGEALIARDQGVPLVLLASIFQKSGVELIVRGDTKARSPADLIGLRVQAGNNPLLDVEFHAMLAAEGIPSEKIPLEPVPPPYSVWKHYERLFNGEVDATLAYGLSLAWAARERGFQYVRMLPSSYGVDFYGDSLFVRQDLIERNPELVERFTRATLRGWAYALENPDAVVRRIAAELPRTIPVNDLVAYNEFLVGRVRDLMVYPLIHIGHVNAMRWREMHFALQRAGLVTNELDVDAFHFDPEKVRAREARAASALALDAAIGIAAGLLIVVLYLGVRRARERTRSRVELERVNQDLRALNEELERRVDARTAQLQRANRDLESFGYSVSHDLRAPLRAVDGFAAILEKEMGAKLADEERRLLGRVRQGAAHMSVMLNGLLDLSRLARESLDRRPVDLSAVAVRVASRLRESDPARTAAIEIQPGMSAEGDERLLEVALTNLIGNAWKFTSSRDAAHIEFRAQASNGRTVYVVGDDGVGFDTRYAPRLFVPFQRFHGETEFAGSGLGLAIVQRVIEKHGGRVWIESAVGKGTRVYFTLETGEDLTA